MPIGIMINFIAIVSGGIIGTLIGKYMTREFVDKMNLVFGLCAFGMGIVNIILMEQMPAVVLALIVGTMVGHVLHLSDLVNKGGLLLQKIISKVVKKKSNLSKEEFESTLVTCVAIFIFSGTGIYGSIISGINGDHSMLMAKSMLDFFTAIIFACNLGYVTSAVAIPQAIFFVGLFLLGSPIYNGLNLANNTYLLSDFKACGGIIIFASGFRMTKIKMMPIADMIPGLMLIFPVSIFWHDVIVPFVAYLIYMF